jgi:hypothetical protein
LGGSVRRSAGTSRGKKSWIVKIKVGGMSSSRTSTKWISAIYGYSDSEKKLFEPMMSKFSNSTYSGGRR